MMHPGRDFVYAKSILTTKRARGERRELEMRFVAKLLPAYGRVKCHGVRNAIGLIMARIHFMACGSTTELEPVEPALLPAYYSNQS